MTVLTPAGHEHLKAELLSIQTTHIPRVDMWVHTAIASGDKAEIEDAKAEREFYSQRVIKLNDMVSNAKIIGGA